MTELTLADIQARLDALQRLHSIRSFNGDGYGWSNCAECHQHWPCATIRVLRGFAPDDTSLEAMKR